MAASAAPVTTVAASAAPVITVVASAAPVVTVAASAAPVIKVTASDAPVVTMAALAASDYKYNVTAPDPIDFSLGPSANGESSDGMGTISDAYERHITSVDVHRTQSPTNAREELLSPSITVESDSTWTASENWEDAGEEFWTMQQIPKSPPGKRDNMQVINDSTEEETEPPEGIIKVTVGSFVNSILGVSKGRENVSKKPKNN